jgi:hypothetical protein
MSVLWEGLFRLATQHQNLCPALFVISTRHQAFFHTHLARHGMLYLRLLLKQGVANEAARTFTEERSRDEELADREIDVCSHNQLPAYFKGRGTRVVSRPENV